MHKHFLRLVTLVLFWAGASFAASNVVVNSGFETLVNTTGPKPTDYGYWSGDESQIVGIQESISPFEGSQMLSFIYSRIGAAGVGNASELFQIIDVTPHIDDIRQGSAFALATVLLNRVHIDSETDTLFAIKLFAYAGLPSSFPSQFMQSELLYSSKSLATDENTGTWESVDVGLLIPSDSDFIVVKIQAHEDVHNDTDGTEFDGHYADEVSVRVFGDALVVDGTSEVLWGNQDYDAILVKNGGSITIPPAEWNGSSWEGGWLRLTTNYLHIDPDCSITADASGYSDSDETGNGGPGAGGDSDGGISQPGGGGYGGEGGHMLSGEPAGITYGTCTEIDVTDEDPCVPQMGSKGGDWGLTPGGAGGGAIVIYANETIVEGTISANGGNGFPVGGGYGSGAGSGGQIAINSTKVHVKPDGIIRTNGGNNVIAGAGGGGRILIDSSDFTKEGRIEAEGGGASSPAYGHDGSVCTPEQYCEPGNPVSQAPTDLDLHPDDDTGLDANDYLTNLSNPRITGHAVPAASITLYEGSTEVGSGSSDTSGNFTVQATLSDGPHTITATAQGYCQSESLQSADSVTLTIDTTQVPRPAAPDLIEDAWNGGQFLDDDIISASYADFAGTVDPCVQVTLYMDGQASAQCFTADGSWSLEAQLLSEGYHQATVRLMDIAGNESDTSLPLPFVVDLTKPQINNMQATPTDCQPTGTIFTMQATVSDSLSGVNTSYGVDCDINYSGQSTVDDVTLPDQGGGLFSGAWDSTGESAGSYTLDFTAYDIAGNRKTFDTGAAICVEAPTPYCGDAEHPYPQGDVTRNCYVDQADLSELNIRWTNDNCTQSNDYCDNVDLNQDGKVDLRDFSLIAATWMLCTAPYTPCEYSP